MAHIRALEQDINHIRDLLVGMGGKLQYMLSGSMRALRENNSLLAEELIQFDTEIDDLELQIDQAIYEVIALRQPAARDLRTILASNKINGEMERIGDLCESIARQVVKLNKWGYKEGLLKDLYVMADLTQKMLAEGIDAFTNTDLTQARKVILMDDEVDEMTHQFVDRLHALMKSDSSKVEAASAILLMVSKFERIADQVTNICEEVVFTITGGSIRHKSHLYAVSGDKN